MFETANSPVYMTEKLNDTLGPVDPVRRWLLTPGQRDALVNIHDRITRVLGIENDRYTLQYLYSEMWCFGERSGYVPPIIAQGFRERSATMETDELKAVMYQLCCRFIQCASNLPVCIDMCCCDCPAAPKDLPCVKRALVR